MTAGAGGSSTTAMETGDSGGILSTRPASTVSLSSFGGSRKASTASLTSLGATGERASMSVVEDDVDQFLSKEDGRIPRGKNDQMSVFNMPEIN